MILPQLNAKHMQLPLNEIIFIHSTTLARSAGGGEVLRGALLRDNRATMNHFRNSLVNVRVRGRSALIRFIYLLDCVRERALVFAVLIPRLQTDILETIFAACAHSHIYTRTPRTECACFRVRSVAHDAITIMYMKQPKYTYVRLLCSGYNCLYHY